MIHFIKSLLTVFLLALFVVAPSAQGALNAYDRQEFTFENALADKNPGFESGVTQWTASGGTFVSNSGTQIIPNSKQFATWDSNSASQTLQTSAVTVPKTGNCEFSIWIAVPSGTATHTITVTDGSNDLVTAQTITNNTNALKHIVNFPCPASGTVRGKLTSVNANEPSISLDNARLGSATTVGSVDVDTPWIAFTPSGSWVTNTTYTGLWRKNGDNYEYQVYLALTGAPTATALTINHLVTGVTQDTAKLLNTSTDGRQTMAECIVRSAATVYDSTAYYNGTNIAPIVKAAGGTYATASTNVNATVPGTFANGDSIYCKGSVPILGWPSTTVLLPEAQGWYVDAEISGGNPSLGTASVSSYTELTNASLTMTPRSGSAAVGIMCSSTNAATAPTTSTSTCAAGSESLGANFVVPRSGSYDVCMDFSHNATVDQAVGVNAAFQVVETPTNAQTITTEGGSRIQSSHTGMAIASGNSDSKTFPHKVCGQFNWSSGTKGVRLMYEQLVGGTPVTSQILADGSTSVGQRNFRLTVRPVTSQQQTVLANSVISRDVVNGQVTTVNTVVSKSTTYTATANEETIVASMSGGAWTLLLPAAAGVKGKRYYIILPDDSANGLTIDPNSTETICGQSTVVMRGLRDSMEIQSDGTNWVGLGESCWRTNTARLDCDSGSTIPVDRQRLVSSIGNISGGTCGVTLNTGNYSGAPTIVVSWNGTASSSDFYGVCSSATACAVGGGGAVTSAQIDVIVRGPR